VTARHSTTATWVFPPAREPQPDRTNLKELAARPERFEHHLTVVAQLGVAQLEIATASEPVCFAHVNISDEYAVALPTGDVLVDAFPMRTFVSEPMTGADVGRYNHRSGDLVLHPHGFAHWPGKLRPPYLPMAIPAGLRRCVLSLVYCANVPTPSTAPIVALPAGRKLDDVKPYTDPPPTLSMAAVLNGPPGVIARVGNTQLALVEKPGRIAPPRGGWVVIVAGTAPHAACDLIRLAPGESLDGAGVERALVLTGDAEPDPIPPSWTSLLPAPFPRYEDAPPGVLPFKFADLAIEELAPSTVAVRLDKAVVEVPRYWLARMLFRVALHDLRLNHVETYGGFFVDDSGEDIAIGLHLAGERRSIRIPRTEARDVIERLYRAVAPPGYTERLS